MQLSFYRKDTSYESYDTIFCFHVIPKLRLPCEIIFTLLTGVHDMFSYDSKEGYHILNLIEIDDSQIGGDLTISKNYFICSSKCVCS